MPFEIADNYGTPRDGAEAAEQRHDFRVLKMM